MSDRQDLFTRILAAKESPQNRCMGPPGAWLVPAGNRDKPGFPVPADEHFFVALKGRKANRYGWVTCLDEPLTAEALQERDRQSLIDEGTDPRDVEVGDLATYQAYLKSVARYAEGTPMLCSFREVRLPGVQRRTLNVHKVFFHSD